MDKEETPINGMVLKFAEQMQIELDNNIHKGDWTGWTEYIDIFYEIEYHKAKLLMAIKANDQDLMREHIADCANHLMFLGNAFILYEDK